MSKSSKRQFLLVVAALAVWIFPRAALAMPVDIDHQPAGFRDSQMELYRAVLSGVLAPKRPNGSCLQMVSLGDSSPESMVYHDCLGEAEGAPGKLVYVRAQKNIWSVLRKQGVHAALQVKVKRSEVRIEVQSGLFLRELWLNAISRAQPVQRSVMDDQREYFLSACRLDVGCPGAWSRSAQGWAPLARCWSRWEPSWRWLQVPRERARVAWKQQCRRLGPSAACWMRRDRSSVDVGRQAKQTRPGMTLRNREG